MNVNDRMIENVNVSYGYNPMILCDFYKIAHRICYKEGTESIYSMLVGRNNKYLPVADKIVAFGFLKFTKEYLIEYFNTNFFNRDKKEIVDEYVLIVGLSLDIPFEKVDTSHIEELHDLGYLPLRVSAVKEGTLVPFQVPVLVVENTLPSFFWLTNYIETLMSAELWHSMTSATKARSIRQVMDEYALKTTGSTDAVDFLGHDFSMRGMSGLYSGINSGMAHLLFYKGTDTIPAIQGHMKYYNADIRKEFIGGSIPACYDNKTEILTENGWKLFKDLKVNEKVAQYHEDGSINFVVPTQYYNMPYKGDMIKFSNKDDKRQGTIDILVTPNHRMIRRRSANLELQVIEAGNNTYHNKNVYGSKNYLIISGNKKDGKINNLSDLDKLRIAFQADGSVFTDDEKRNGRYSNEFTIRFAFKKDRKIKNLKNILDNLGYNYNMYEKDERGYTNFYVKTPIKLNKNLNTWVNLSDKTYNWCKEFLQELINWDGSVNGKDKDLEKNSLSYCSVDKINVDVVQSVASIADCKTRIGEYLDKRGDRQLLYYITIVPNKVNISGEVSKKSIEYYDGTVHCVSVPTKMLVVRRNNVVVISGNTEHSVMCSLTPPDGDRDEYEAFKQIITEEYPEGFISIVSDTYDFDRVVSETLPRLKNEIMSRNGKVVIRPDSGDPVEILCGKRFIDLSDDLYVKTLDDIKEYFHDEIREDERTECGDGFSGDESISYDVKYDNKYYKVTYEVEYNRHDKRYYYVDTVSFKSLKEVFPTTSELGLVESLWNTFGGEVNDLGYKVLDSHIGVIYGDSMNYERISTICRRLEEKGFASTNFVSGVGSYFYTGSVTRDSLGFAIKATHSVVNGKDVKLFKDPKTDVGKRSLKGRAVVYELDGEIVCKDNLTRDEEVQFIKENNIENLLLPLFENGKILREDSLKDIRLRVKGN